MAANDAERANPWLLLNRDEGDGAVPVIADANSMTYVLHKDARRRHRRSTRGGRPVRLRLVAALDDSIFQGELLMSEANFLKLFPEQEGYQFLLVEAAADRAAAVAAAIEARAGDLGADAIPTAERLAEFHAVENTYLSTFQTLGGLGLLVGTVGLAAVLLRNVLERRRELALLGAVGYRRGHIFAIVVAENALLLAWGLAVGAFCAVVAIAPALREHGGRLPAEGAATLIVAVFAGGLLSSAIATRAALRAPLLDALRSGAEFSGQRRKHDPRKTCAMTHMLRCFVACGIRWSAVRRAENWPQWRGPSLNGLSGEKNLPVRWSKTENIAWKLALPAMVRLDAHRLGRPHLPERRRRDGDTCISGASTARRGPCSGSGRSAAATTGS